MEMKDKIVTGKTIYRIRKMGAMAIALLTTIALILCGGCGNTNSESATDVDAQAWESISSPDRVANADADDSNTDDADTDDLDTEDETIASEDSADSADNEDSTEGADSSGTTASSSSNTGTKAGSSNSSGSAKTSSTKTNSTSGNTKTEEATTAKSNTEKQTEKSTESKSATHTHNYTLYNSVQPNCVTAGENTYKCSCGATKTETVPATGVHVYGNVETIQGDCTTDTVKVSKCLYCDAAKTTVVKAAAGHQWVTTTEQKVVGSKVKSAYDVCNTCGLKFATVEGISAHKSETLELYGPDNWHSGSHTETEYEYVYETVTTTKCSVCGATK